MGYIYTIKNITNEKYYIGQTIQEPEKRWYKHKWSCVNRNDCVKLGNALKKYGIYNFEFQVIYECNNKFLNHFEKCFIKEYDSFYNGYNLTSGGDSNYERSEETKEKLRQVNLGKKHTKETKEKCRIANLDVPNTIKQNERNSRAHKGKERGELKEKHKENVSVSLLNGTIRTNKNYVYPEKEQIVLELLGIDKLPKYVYFNKSKDEIIGFRVDAKINGVKVKKRISNRNNIKETYEKIMEFLNNLEVKEVVKTPTNIGKTTKRNKNYVYPEKEQIVLELLDIDKLPKYIFFNKLNEKIVGFTVDRKVGDKRYRKTIRNEDLQKAFEEIKKNLINLNV